jgi:hypothetical protein
MDREESPPKFKQGLPKEKERGMKVFFGGWGRAGTKDEKKSEERNNEETKVGRAEGTED